MKTKGIKPIPQSTLAKRRAWYQSRIWLYEQRRNELRKKYPRPKQRGGGRGEEYNKKVNTINKRIKYWHRKMKDIDKTTNKIIALGNAVALFTGINPRGSNGRAATYRDKLTKYLFYKWGLEHGMQAKQLREYVGSKRINQPAEYRLEFNKLLRLDTHDAKLDWENFKRYYTEFPVCCDDFIDNRRSPGA